MTKTDAEKCEIITKESKSIMWNYKHTCLIHKQTFYDWNPNSKYCFPIKAKVKDNDK